MKHSLGDIGDQPEIGPAIVRRGGDIQQDDLVYLFLVEDFDGVYWVANVLVILELNGLDQAGASIK